MTSAAAETSRLGAVSLPRFFQQAAAKHSTTLSNQVCSGLAALGELVTIINQWQRGLEACCAHQVYPLHSDPNDLLHTEQSSRPALQLCSLPGAGPAMGRLMPLHSAGAEPESGTARPLQCSQHTFRGKQKILA